MAVAVRILDVFAGPAVGVLLREPEVNHVHSVTRGGTRARVDIGAHEEVGRFDVAMDPVAGVDELGERELQLHREGESTREGTYRRAASTRATRGTYHLVRKQEYCLQREVFIANPEQVLEAWATEVDDHDVVIALPPRPHHPRNAAVGPAHERLVDTGLLLEHGVFCVCGLDLDGDLLARDGVRTHED